MIDVDKLARECGDRFLDSAAHGILPPDYGVIAVTLNRAIAAALEEAAMAAGAEAQSVMDELNRLVAKEATSYVFTADYKRREAMHDMHEDRAIWARTVAAEYRKASDGA